MRVTETPSWLKVMAEVDKDLAFIRAKVVPPSWELDEQDEHCLEVIGRLNAGTATIAEIESCFDAYFFNAFDWEGEPEDSYDEFKMEGLNHLRRTFSPDPYAFNLDPTQLLLFP